MARKGGEVLVVGVPWSPAEYPARRLLIKLFWRQLTVRSGYEWALPWLPVGGQAGSYRDNCRVILRHLHEGTRNTDKLWRCVSPSDCQSVYQEWMSGQTTKLCAVFDWRNLAVNAGPVP